MMPDTETRADNELRIERVFDASPEFLFRMWTDPSHVARWFGPRGFDCPHFETDPTPGGAWRGCIRSDSHGEIWSGGEYQEVSVGRRLVFTFAWDGEPETLVTIDFEALDEGRTRQVFHQTPFRSVESRDSHHGGWSEAFDCAAEFIKQAGREVEA